MRSLVALCLLAGCASAPEVPPVIVEPDPVSGAPTAYTTIFLDVDGARAVLSAPVGKAARVAVTLWLPEVAVDGSCGRPSIVIDGHEVQGAEPEARILDTPSGADQTVAFDLPPVVLRDARLRPASLAACGRVWELDDADRAAIEQFLRALEPA